MQSQECEECGLTFQSQAELTNHKKKFCLNSRYGGLDELEKNFQSVSQNRDISKFGKMSLAMQGRSYNFATNQQTTDSLDLQYRQILKKIEEQRTLKNQLQTQKNKAFRELQALEKQQQQLIISQKRDNLQSLISKREALAKEEDQLQREIKEYQSKKMGWEKSMARGKDVVDAPYQQGIKAGKLSLQRNLLQQRKHHMQMQLNAKRREKQKLEQNILGMSQVVEIPASKESNVTLTRGVANRSAPGIKIAEPSSKNNSQLQQHPVFDYSKLNNDRPQSQSSQISKTSSYLHPNSLDNTLKMLKFNLNKQGKSEQDKLIQTIMAQQYDDLTILSRLPKGSDLYNMKMKQYTELSKHRMEVQEKAQKQRIQKMKKQFQFQKALADKEKNNTKWVTENRKDFMKKQLDILHQHHATQEAAKAASKNSSMLSRERMALPEGVKQLPRDARPSVQPNIPNLGSNKQQPPQKKDPFGYRISILFLRNYPSKKPIRIKIIIYEQYYHQKQAETSLKYQFNTIYHEQSLSKSDPFNPHYKNKLDETGAIAYNESFYVPQNLLDLYKTNQKQMYILFIAAEKDQSRVTNQPVPYCWYSFKVTHFGQIKQGRFTVNLYADTIMFPYPADMNKMKRKMQQQLTFQVEEVLLDEHTIQSLKKTNPSAKSQPSQQQQQPQQPVLPSSNHSNPLSNLSSANNPQPLQKSNNSNPLSSKKSEPSQEKIGGDKISMNYGVRIKNVDEESALDVDQEYFYSNQKPTQFSHIQQKKPLNFDISVSGLRTLPSYIGPTKLQLSLIDADSAQILPKQQFLADIGTDLYNPIISYTRKIRNESRIPPSTIVFIRIIAISAIDYQVYSLGFSLIYLFLDKKGAPITSNKINDYFMTSGFYQLPIFWGNIQPRYIDLEELLTKYPPIPCSSILIGIRQNASKISNPMPAYSQKVYNTILFQIDQNQSKLFCQQYKRQPLDTNTLLSGYLQYKGIKKNYSGQQINKYLFKTLTFSNQNTKQRLQLKWMAQYLQFFGMTFIIDKLYIPEGQLMYYYFITICICPPANYYKQKSFDLIFCRKINFQMSTATEFVFYDNQFFMSPGYFKNSSVIIEINRIQIFQSENTQADNNIEGFAYAVIPLFELQEKIQAVNVCQQTIPMLDGDFDSNNIQKLEKTLPQYLTKTSSSSKKSKAQLSFRLLNGYFMNQYPGAVPIINEETRMYKDIPPENMSFEDALDDINSILSSNYNMQIS